MVLCNSPLADRSTPVQINKHRVQEAHDSDDGIQRRHNERQRVLLRSKVEKSRGDSADVNGVLKLHRSFSVSKYVASREKSKNERKGGYRSHTQPRNVRSAAK